MPRNPIQDLLEEFTRQYGAAVTLLMDEIKKNIAKGYSADRAVKIALKRHNLTSFAPAWIENNLVTAAAIGFGVETVTGPNSIKRSLLSATWDRNDFKLSDRLHALPKETERIILDTVADGMRKSKSTKQIAESLDFERVFPLDRTALNRELNQYMERVRQSGETMARGYAGKKDVAEFHQAMYTARKNVERLSQNGATTSYLKAAYSETLDRIVGAVKSLDVASIDGAIRVALFDRARYHAERIARTETARAYGVGAAVRYQNDSDVIGIRWRTSSRHPEADICDLHAEVNAYDMGPGVYPKDALPYYPAHPHCLCVLSSVFKGEAVAKDGKDYKPGRVQSYLNRQDPAMQKALLGVGGREQFNHKPKSWGDHLKNWNGHRDPNTLKLKESDFK